MKIKKKRERERNNRVIFIKPRVIIKQWIYVFSIKTITENNNSIWLTILQRESNNGKITTISVSNLISCVTPQQYHDNVVRTLQFHPTRFSNRTRQRTPPSRPTLVSVGIGSSLLCVLLRHRFFAYLSPFWSYGTIYIESERTFKLLKT